MTRLRSLPVATTAALVLGGCAASATPDSATPRTPVLDASLTTLQGAAFDPTTIEGRPVILWFWAPWCTICRGEGPAVAQVAAELEAEGSDVVLLGVPGRGETPEMDDFVADTGTGGITHVVDADGDVWRAYGVFSQPAFALITADGEVRVVQGALGADGLRNAAVQVSGG